MNLVKNNNSLSWRLIQSDGVDEVQLDLEELKQVIKDGEKELKKVKKWK